MMKNILKNIENLNNLGNENLVKNTFSTHPDVIEIYFKEIVNEINEAKEELKKDNAVYLEDELGDIFWDYWMLLKLLERDGYIRSLDKVFSHSLEKFSERYRSVFGVDGENKDSGIREKIWSEVKVKQKDELKKRHNKLYTK